MAFLGAKGVDRAQNVLFDMRMTPKDLLIRLGGPAEVAKAFDIAPSTPREWGVRKSIPVKFWPRLIALARAKGIQTDADGLMRMMCPDAADVMDRLPPLRPDGGQ